jgi:hypothetical protein
MSAVDNERVLALLRRRGVVAEWDADEDLGFFLNVTRPNVGFVITDAPKWSGFDCNYAAANATFARICEKNQGYTGSTPKETAERLRSMTRAMRDPGKWMEQLL